MKKIIVIDDSEVNLYLVKSLFEDEKNVQVDVETDSREAFKSIQKEPPDLIILDLMMPFLDGFQFLFKLKTVDSLSRIPVIVISARQDSEAINLAYEYGATDYIQKPLKLEEVKLKIDQFLYKKMKA